MAKKTTVLTTATIAETVSIDAAPKKSGKTARRRRKVKSEAQRSTFKAYQIEKQHNRKDLIIATLGDMRKSKTEFVFLTDLAKEVAKRLSTVEKPCSPSTLLRNSDYRDLLVRHHDNSSTKTSDTHSQKALLLAKIDTTNLAKEVARLKACITFLEEQALMSESHKVREAVIQHPSDMADTITKERQINLNLRQAFALLLSHFNGIISVDPQTGDIVDLSTRSNNVVVPARFCD